MERVSLYDAKARLSDLVERAEGGESTVITKRGRVVAKIVPAQAPDWDRREVLDDAEQLRRTIKVSRRVNLAGILSDGRL